VLYYIFNLPIMLGVEKAVLKRSGVSAAGICTIAGVSASVPMVIAQTTPAVAIYAPKAAAIVTFGVIFSSILSPIIVKHLYQKGQGK
jgi:2-keto-3-deoxygluconate permease